MEEKQHQLNLVIMMIEALILERKQDSLNAKRGLEINAQLSKLYERKYNLYKQLY